MAAPIAEVAEGRLQGYTKKNLDGEDFFCFIGIPYAQPPVGKLRFKDPVPVKPWQGTKDATKEGSVCYQRDFFTNTYKGSEDCLFINVFTKSLPGQKSTLRPVMVYIHGGGFIFESSSPETFGPEHLITEDVVFVSFNYRLGIVGFLSSEDASLGVPGNVGLKDQVLALKWIKNNVKNFNGDPDNITIFGNSAGSTCVHLHVLSKMSKGLFHRAILQSGTVFNPWSWGSRNQAMDIVKHMGRNDDNEAEAMEILREAPIGELYEAQEKIYDNLSANLLRPFGPVIEYPNDTAFMTRHPIDTLASGEYNKVPMLFGYNLTEGMFTEYNKRIFPQHPETVLGSDSVVDWQMCLEKGSDSFAVASRRIQDFYWSGVNGNDKYMPFTDCLYMIGVYSTIRNHIKSSDSPIYLYRMSFEGGLNTLKVFGGLTDLPGVCHADELGYLFKNSALPDVPKGSREDKTIRTFVELWTNFAASGNPTLSSSTRGKSNLEWKPMESGKIHLLDIGDEPKLVTNPESERSRIEFWEGIFELSPKTANFLS
ncbi:unnamed protein product [Phaedon cochleariae]|uniref:Carboxylesterase type B domain-containing protein n=1 Tax=Phaedon cochleariae TaxID=80249 RepID=A0A9P0DU88_PHACE|nr:unnamed protein product [Phaedon cochleariae]